jgi:hypothetical protein
MPMTSSGQPGFNSYAAGVKRYGPNASSAATSGPVDPSGYIDREARNRLKKQVYLKWIQDNTKGAYGSANAMRRG